MIAVVHSGALRHRNRGHYVAQKERRLRPRRCAGGKRL